MEHKIKILTIAEDTFETRVLVTEKPEGFDFTPGQAVNLAIAKTGWRDEERPFTMTSLPDDPCLQFTIKTYPERDGVTDEMRDLKAGDELLMGDPWGAIEYKGQGLFIAGGSGITPFLAIIRDLHRRGELKGNVVLSANAEAKEAIAAAELKTRLGDHCKFFLSDEKHPAFQAGTIDKEAIEEYKKLSGGPYVYLCGPPEMTEEINEILKDLGISDGHIISEKSN